MGMIKDKDCCCKDWKSVIKELWAHYQDMVTSVMVGGVDYNPDGEGKVTIPGVISDGTTITAYPTYYTLKVLDIGNTTIYDNTTYYTIEVSI